MNKNLQDLIVVLIVVIATYFIGKKLWDNFRHKKGDGGCAKCDPEEINNS